MNSSTPEPQNQEALPVVGYLYTHPCVDPWLTTNGGATLLPDTRQYPLVRADAAAAAIAQRDAEIAALREQVAALRRPMTDEQIEAGRRATFSTDNPFCPCDSKTMRKAVRWAEYARAALAAGQAAPLRQDEGEISR